MKFSFEVPIKYLNEFDNEQDYLFILAHHLSNKKYYDYCKQSIKMKILDNGAYELGESISPEILLNYAILLDVDIIVIPDKLFDKRRSLQLETKFHNLLFESSYSFRLMKVVCGKNIKEYLKSLIEVANDDKVDIIGISQSRHMITPNLSYVMEYLYSFANDFINGDKPIHLLGLTHPYELIEAHKYNSIETIDTGRPINFAFHNKLFPLVKRFDNYKKERGYDINTKKKLNVELAKKNIRRLKKYYAAY